MKFKGRIITVIKTEVINTNHKAKKNRINHLLYRLEQERGKEKPNLDFIHDFKEELHELQKPNLVGTQIRSKCKLAEKYEIPNAFFYLAEKQRQQKKAINEVKVGKDLITDPVQVRETVKDFYMDLSDCIQHSRITIQEIQEYAIQRTNLRATTRCCSVDQI